VNNPFIDGPGDCPSNTFEEWAESVGITMSRTEAEIILAPWCELPKLMNEKGKNVDVLRVAAWLVEEECDAVRSRVKKELHATCWTWSMPSREVREFQTLQGFAGLARAAAASDLGGPGMLMHARCSRGGCPRSGTRFRSPRRSHIGVSVHLHG